MKIEIAKRPQRRPLPRLVVYGDDGVGKTTFAVGSALSALIPTEIGAEGLDVVLVVPEGQDKVKTWDQLLDAVRAMIEQKHDRSWVVIDSITFGYELCRAYIIANDFDGAPEKFNSWGAGEKATGVAWLTLLDLLDTLRSRRGCGVILVAHTKNHKVGNSDGVDWEAKGADVSHQVWALTKRWADQVGYAGFDVRVSKGEDDRAGVARVASSKRYLWFEKTPSRDAKSRSGYEMPARIDLRWADYALAYAAGSIEALVKRALDAIAAAPADRVAAASKQAGGDLTKDLLVTLPAQRLRGLIEYLTPKQGT